MHFFILLLYCLVMAKLIGSKKFTGVLYRESKRRHKGRADRIYWIKFQDARGKTQWEQIGRLSEGITEQYSHQIRTERINMAHHGELPVDRKKQAVVLEDVFSSYIENSKSEGKHTAPEQSRYDKHIHPVYGDCTLNEISESGLISFKAKLGENLSPQTVKHVLALMRRVINHGLYVKLWQGTNPVSPQAGFKMPKVENKSQRFLTSEEARLLLDELEKRSLDLRDMAFLSITTGLRATSIFKLKNRDIDSIANVIHAIDKGGRHIIVDALPSVIRLLANRPGNPEELIFPNRNGTVRNEVPDTFSRAVNALQLNDGITDRRHLITFHTLRHTWASWLAQSGDVTLQELMELGHWERYETVLRYAHLIPGSNKEKLQIINEQLSSAPDRPPLALVPLRKKRQG